MIPRTVDELTFVASEDRADGLDLCGWRSDRAQLFPEAERAAALAPLAAGASTSELDDARRDVAVRKRIANLVGRLAAAPAVSGTEDALDVRVGRWAG